VFEEGLPYFRTGSKDRLTMNNDRRSMLTAFILGASLMFTATIQAADLVVDNVAGNDSQNDRRLVAGPPSYGPYRTINRALLAAGPGDRIVLTNTGEPYRECISICGRQHSGTLESPLEIVGNGAVLDGSMQTTRDDWAPIGHDVWQMVHTPPGFGLLTRDGQLLPYQPIATGQSLTDLAALSWTRVGPSIFFRGRGPIGPVEYAIAATDQTTGITLYDVRNVKISNLTVRGYRIDGINAFDRVDDVRLVNVTCIENGRAGVTVAGASRIGITGSQLRSNGQAQIRVEGQAAAYVQQLTIEAGIGVETLTESNGQIIPLQ
jgi:hypothetical protein